MLLKLILKYYDDGVKALQDGADFKSLSELPVREKIGRFKYIEEKEISASYNNIYNQINEEISSLVASREVE